MAELTTILELCFARRGIERVPLSVVSVVLSGSEFGWRILEKSGRKVVFGQFEDCPLILVLEPFPYRIPFLRLWNSLVNSYQRHKQTYLDTQENYCISSLKRGKPAFTFSK